MPSDAPAVSFDTVCRHVEVTLGASWYFNPARWGTWDGFAPYAAVWDAWRTLAMSRAMLRLSLVRAISPTKAGERAGAILEADVKEALHA